MKRMILAVSILGFALVSAGCQNAKSRAVEGAVIGGVLGAATGGIIGHQSNHGGAGAGIGAAVGAITGGLIGSQIEKKGQAGQPVSGTQAGEVTKEAGSSQMSVLQVIELSKQGVTDDIIIDRIKKSNSKFNLSAEDVEYLKKQGISQKVIDAMQAV